MGVRGGSCDFNDHRLCHCALADAEGCEDQSGDRIEEGIAIFFMEHPGTRRFNRTTNSYVVQGNQRSVSTISSIFNLNIRIAYIVMIQFRSTFD